MSHAPHPDSHEHGLSDTCIECVSRIADPTGLDADNMRRIWSGNLITKTDRQVYDTLYRAAVLHQRLLAVSGVSINDRRGAFEFGGNA